MSGEVEPEPPAFPQGAAGIPQQTLVVLDPMEGGVREHHVELRHVAQIVDVHQEKQKVLPALRPGRLDHAARGIDADHLPMGNQIGDSRRDRTIPAPKVENPLGSLQIEFRNQLRPPFLLVGGGLSVFLAIEFVCHVLSA